MDNHDQGTNQSAIAVEPVHGLTRYKPEKLTNVYTFSSKDRDVLNGDVRGHDNHVVFHFETNGDETAIYATDRNVVATISWGNSPTLRYEGEEEKLNKWFAPSPNTTYV